ncbi:hypothetical protein Ae406Ps2_3024c [Pseudonocardia sp. Ae406_Ps2]|nr:hypothetical protein Ae331Ps2_2905 [Pseudonocardia sp. Ae331_Ps2]OLM03024.1 hypothetical protein Ae406Ps2_3024c [Pseudonocardia sp. Ae406_Ps2]
MLGAGWIYGGYYRDDLTHGGSLSYWMVDRDDRSVAANRDICRFDGGFACEMGSLDEEDWNSF